MKWPADCKLPKEVPSYCHCCWKCLWKHWFTPGLGLSAALLRTVFSCGRPQSLLAMSECPENHRSFSSWATPLFSNTLSPVLLSFHYRFLPPLFSGIPAPAHTSGVVLLISPTHSEASFLLSQATVLHNHEVGGFSSLTKRFFSASNCLMKTSLGCP